MNKKRSRLKIIFQNATRKIVARKLITAGQWRRFWSRHLPALALVLCLIPTAASAGFSTYAQGIESKTTITATLTVVDAYTKQSSGVWFQISNGFINF